MGVFRRGVVITPFFVKTEFFFPFSGSGIPHNHQHRGISRIQTYELASDLPQPPMESAVATCFEKMEKFLLGHRLLRYTRFESPTQTGIRNWSGVELNQIGLATSGLAALVLGPFPLESSSWELWCLGCMEAQPGAGESWWFGGGGR